MILCGDSVEMLKTLPVESVDLTVTSPPYDDLRTYGHGKTFNFEGTAKELYRVTKKGGVVCWNVNDSVVRGSETLTSCKQKIFFREQCGFLIWDTMIWRKSNSAKPTKVRYSQNFEYVFIFSKGKPKTFNPICDKKNVTAGRKPLGRHSLRNKDGTMAHRKNTYYAAEFGMRSNVWDGNTRGQEEMCEQLPHPAMMPKWLVRDLIISWSNKGDVVLDPFSGSGTTPQLAKRLERAYIAIDISEKYVEEQIIPNMKNIDPLFEPRP